MAKITPVVWSKADRQKIVGRARRIARTYETNLKAAATPKRVIVVAPRFRPLSELTREIYRLACEIDHLRVAGDVEKHVRDRCRGWGIEIRPRRPTVIDWTVRLVRGVLASANLATEQRPQMLFEDWRETELCAELNFAFRHAVATECVSMFIDEFGGYKMITSNQRGGGYDFRRTKWLAEMQRAPVEMGPEARRFLISKQADQLIEIVDDVAEKRQPKVQKIKRARPNKLL